MSRHSLYQPRIQDRNVRRLYRLKVWFREQNGRRIPMTVLLNRILDDFFDAGMPLPPGEGCRKPNPAPPPIPHFKGRLSAPMSGAERFGQANLHNFFISRRGDCDIKAPTDCLIGRRYD